MQTTILTVDDEKDVCELISYHLNREGYRVVSASCGREALEMVRLHRPELIILDLMLPDIDGFGVCEILRREVSTATIPIIIVSAWQAADSRHLGLELGALEYLTKPFSPRILVEHVNRLLNLRPARASLPVGR